VKKDEILQKIVDFSIPLRYDKKDGKNGARGRKTCPKSKVYICAQPL